MTNIDEKLKAKKDSISTNEEEEALVIMENENRLYEMSRTYVRHSEEYGDVVVEIFCTGEIQVCPLSSEEGETTQEVILRQEDVEFILKKWHEIMED